MHRSNSDGGRSGFRAAATSGSPVVGTPPGLGSRRSQNTDAWYGSSLPTAEGWGLSDAAENTSASSHQAASDAAHNLPASVGTSSGGNRNSRGSLAGQYAQKSSPGQGRSQTGNSRHRNMDSSNLGRNSGPQGLGRRASGSPHVQSNFVPIPKRYLNNPSGPAGTPSNSQQHQGTPNSRGRYGITPKDANKIGSADRTRHSEYWPQDLLQKGFKNMKLFRSVMRINAGDKTQAYASLPGLSADIFIRGFESQNRSVEGDEVALRILPPCAWWVFKREQLKAAQKAAAKGQSGESQGIDLAGTDTAAISEVATPAALSMENAGSGGEIPYQFADTDGPEVDAPDGLGSAQILQPLDEDSVFDMSDITSSGGTGLASRVAAQSARSGQHQTNDTPTRFPPGGTEGDQDAGSTLDSESALGIPESPAESSGMQDLPSASLSSHADSFSWSAALADKLSLDDSQKEGMPDTPDSMVAMGSAPSTTLSDFSAVGGPGDREGLGQKGPTQGRRSSYSSNRRRSVDNRDNGAPRDSVWHGVESVEAAVRILNDLMLKFPGMRPTAEVVGILNKSVRRQQVVGILQQEHAGDVLMLIASDPRMPHMMVNAASMPFELGQQLQAEARDPTVVMKTLVSGIMTTWAAGSVYPLAEVRSALGQAGELEAETLALLEMEAVSSADFSPEVLACLPQDLPWSISAQDRTYRRDFTGIRLFSIDPPTARDLDDALSIQQLPGGNFRVGVHIADVAHFIRQGSALDEEAQARATSVYLVQRVIPMLPRLLCEQLCSLNPGVERLAFSITWDLTPKGKILAQWAGRSIIKSCVKLAYGHAQDIIEGKFAGLPDQETPSVELHGYAWPEVVEDVLGLNGIARHLKAGRASNGALRLDNTKLYFKMDDNGNPVSAAPYVQREANQLVEEFMLLANMSVAKIVANAFPEQALLRRHPPPDERKIGDLVQMAEDLGLSLDVSTAGSIAHSLQALREGCADKAVMEVVTLLATKPMKNAEYFSTGDFEDATKWHHYALAVSHYTHFTSPIRRYPDVLVHRLLAAALRLNPSLTQLPADMPCDQPQPGPPPADTVSSEVVPANLAHSAIAASGEAAQAGAPDDAAEDDGHRGRTAAVTAQHGLVDGGTVSAIATHCNQRKQAAKNVQDGSLRLYLCVLLRQNPIVTEAVCLQIGGNRFIDVYISELGMDRRIHFEHMLPAVTADFDKEQKSLTLTRLHQTPQRDHRHQAGKENSTQQHPESNVGPAVIDPSLSKSDSRHRGTGAEASNPLNSSGPEECDASTSAGPESEPCMQGIEFLQNLKNPSNLQPVSLPLQLKLFARIPVVISARLFGQTGKPSETFVHMLVK